jgi:precorrin-2 dehydrogenase/sirohydrochlorin ferrochelatase
MTNPLYSMFLNLCGRTCVVVGGDEVAECKIRDLLDAGAKLRVIAPWVTTAIAEWSQADLLHWETRSFAAGDLRDAFLVVSVADSATNRQVFTEADARQIFCNAVDDTEQCSCFAPAVVRRGPLQIAISTAGRSPALAQRLRQEMEEQFGPEYAPWVEELGEKRQRLFQYSQLDRERRRAILHEQASAAAFKTFRYSLQKEEVDRHVSAENPHSETDST